MSFEKSELEAKHQKYKGRVVLRGDIVKDDSGSYAVCTEQGSSASQMTAAKVMDIISRLPGCAGQAADAVSAYTQVKMKDAPKLLKIQKSECPDIWIRLPRHKWPKSWSSIEDPVVPLERNLYGHVLCVLLWSVCVCVVCVCVVCVCVLCVLCVCCVCVVCVCVLCVLCFVRSPHLPPDPPPPDALFRTALFRTVLRRTTLRRTAQNFALFFSLSRSIFALFCLSLGVFSLNFGGCCQGWDPQMCTFGLSGCRVKPRRLRGRRCFRRQPKNSKRAHLTPPAL